MKLVLDKSFDFSIRIIELAKYLDEERSRSLYVNACLRAQQG